MKNLTLRRFSLTILTTLFLLSYCESAWSQVKPDARIGFFTDGSNLSLGGGVQFRLENRFAIEPSAEFIFTTGATTLFLSGDGQYYFLQSGVSPYAGAGLGILYSSANGASNTNAGLNLFGGVEFTSVVSVTPYVQVKAFFSQSTLVQLAGGVRF